MNSLDNQSLGLRLSEDEPFAYNTLIWVFKYLDLKDILNCTRVCKIWCWIAHDEILWKYIAVRCCTKHTEDVTKNYGGKIRNLELFNPKLLSLESLKYVSSKMVNLSQIKFYGCSKDQLKLLAENHKNLEKIYAEINWGKPLMSLDFITDLKNLTHLELITHIEITEVHNFKKLDKLKHLVFHVPCDESCWKYVAEVENLESISLDANIGTSWDIGLFDSGFHIKGLKHLGKLQINDLPYFHEYGILEKIKDLPNLKGLSSVKEFYNLDNATALKVDGSKKHSRFGTRSPFIKGVAPITMTKLLSTLQERLPNTKVSLLDPQNQSDISKTHCFVCDERAATAQDRMRSYT